MKNSFIFPSNMKENCIPNTQRYHVSQQTKQKPFKPAIKVGYSQPESGTLTTRRYKKPVVLPKNTQRHSIGVKKVPQNNNHHLSSGLFPSEPGQSHTFQKKGVQEAHEKYYGGKQIDEQLKQQFSIKRSRSAYLNNEGSKSRLTTREPECKKVWEYNKMSIKDIIEYQHAGQFKPSKLAPKCTNERTEDRKLKYRDIHEYDFRKSKPMIR